MSFEHLFLKIKFGEPGKHTKYGFTVNYKSSSFIFIRQDLRLCTI